MVKTLLFASLKCRKWRGIKDGVVRIDTAQ